MPVAVVTPAPLLTNTPRLWAPKPLPPVPEMERLPLAVLTVVLPSER